MKIYILYKIYVYQSYNTSDTDYNCDYLEAMYIF